MTSNQQPSYSGYNSHHTKVRVMMAVIAIAH